MNKVEFVQEIVLEKRSEKVDKKHKMKSSDSNSLLDVLMERVADKEVSIVEQLTLKPSATDFCLYRGRE